MVIKGAGKMAYIGALTSGVVFVALFFGVATVVSYVVRFFGRD